MQSKKIDVIALKGIRKASHVSGKAVRRTGSIIGRIENKTTKIIDRKTRTKTSNSVPVDDFFYKNYPYLFPIHPALPNIGQKPSVTVFVPSLVKRGFFGGIATLLITSAALAKKLDMDYRVVQTSGFEKKSTVLEFLEENGISISTDRFSMLDVSYRNTHKFAYLPLHPDDVIVVSAWWDAHIASQLPLKKRFLYMLQDYEPIFYNNGDSQQLAEATYFSNNFAPLCNTELMYKYFSVNSYDYITKNAAWFEPAVALKPEKSKNNNEKAKKLFLYGRPQVERNMFYTAIKALDIALQDEAFNKYHWTIYSAGQSDVPDISLKSGHIIKNLGKMEINKYYDFVLDVDIALSPMLAPHPNYPTLEFASVNSMVVTTKYKTKDNLENYSKNIILCDPNAESMASGLIDAAKKHNIGKVVSSSNINSDWIKTLDAPLDNLIKKFNYV